MRELVFNFKWFDSWYCYLRLNKNFRILAEIFKQNCQYCILRVEMNNFRKDIFYWNKLSISNCFRILRKKILDIQRKIIKTFETAFNMSGGQIVWENVFPGFVTILHICSDSDGNTFESSAKTSSEGSPNCLIRVQMKDSNERLSFETFKFKTFSRLAENIQQCYENLILCVQLNLWRMRFYFE